MSESLTPQNIAKVDGLLRQLAQNEKFEKDQLAQIEQRNLSRIEIEQKARDHFEEIIPQLMEIAKRLTTGSNKSHCSRENSDVIQLHFDHFTVTAKFKFFGGANRGERPGIQLFSNAEDRNFEFDFYRSGWIKLDSNPSIETAAISEAEIAGHMVDLLTRLTSKRP